MSSRYESFYDQAQAVIDSVAHEKDPAVRLQYVQRMLFDLPQLLRKQRDRAAYELRLSHSGEAAANASGMDRHQIEYWSDRWISANGLPKVKYRARRIPERPVDLSGGSSQPLSE